MQISVSDAVREAGQQLILSRDNSLTSEMNRALNRFLGWPFQTASGFATDAEGSSTATFGVMVYVASEPASDQAIIHIDVDKLGCVIDAYESLSRDQLRAAYERVASAKRLKKTSVPKVKDVPQTTVTLGIILARDSQVPLDILAQELEELNRLHPDHEWTDMLVVLSKGTVNYGAQFPGEPAIGDFLPPEVGTTNRYSPPVYVVMMIKPDPAYAFNRMCSFLCAHLMIFSPGARRPNWLDVLAGARKEVLTITGYQYDLAGHLKPVPRQFYDDRFIPPRPFLIQSRKGDVLCTLQFLPWQDGGVILLKGKLPLDGLLVFLGKKGIERGGVVNLPQGQISYVLPIGQADFSMMLNRIQHQSNMVVKVDPTQLVVQKFRDEGSSSPLMARLLMGLSRLRDAVFQDRAKRDAFDKPFMLVIENFLTALDTSREIVQMLTEHFDNLRKGDAAQLRGPNIHVEAPIDKALRKEVENFLTSAVRALKQGMQEVTKVLQFDIGFMFRQQSTFEKGAASLSRTHPHLASYVREARKWSERLVNSRNDIEHNGWTLPKLKYAETGSVVTATEPEVSGQRVSEFVTFTADRLACFIEEVTVHCLQTMMTGGISVTEIPLSERVPELPERFRLTVETGGMPLWSIAYHEAKFEEV